MSGFLLINVSNEKNTFDWVNLKLDIRLSGVWDSTSIPDILSPLYSSVPMDTLILQYSKLLSEYLRKHMLPNLRAILQRPVETNECTFPVLTKQTCTAINGVITGPNGPCNPCDTCCNCFMQQRCDGDCKNCACVRCSVRPWTFPLFISSFLMFIVSALFVYNWYYKYL